MSIGEIVTDLRDDEHKQQTQTMDELVLLLFTGCCCMSIAPFQEMLSDTDMTKKKAVVQDDNRERGLAILCGLEHISTRGGPDAKDSFGNLFELKSTTKTGVSTARDVGPHTLQEWRRKYWIIAIGENYETGFEINELYIAHPSHLELVFSAIEANILAKYEPSQRVLKIAENAGASIHDLKIAQYVVNRGVTLNNPKLPVHLIRENATLIEHRDAKITQNQIRLFVEANPIDSNNPEGF